MYCQIASGEMDPRIIEILAVFLGELKIFRAVFIVLDKGF